MPHPDSEDLRAVALYWDFENIHAGLCNEKEPGSYANKDNRFKAQEPLVDVQAVVDMAASFGPIAINRAYCNWQYFGRYRHAMLQHAVELLQLFPPGDNAKNGADIKLCLDAAEDIARFPHIGTVIIVGGDSDFMPVSHKIKAAGRTLIGVGLRKTTNKNWASSCHGFRYYESLAQAPGNAAAPSDLPADLLRRAVRLLGEQRGEEWVDQGAVWPLIKRLDPTFDLKEHGHSSFPAMVKSLGGLIEVQKGTGDQLIRLR
jgi:uncharacterized LabA/DUF88 family protein